VETDPRVQRSMGRARSFGGCMEGDSSRETVHRGRLIAPTEGEGVSGVDRLVRAHLGVVDGILRHLG
jgi:hypothetical protein